MIRIEVVGDHDVVAMLQHVGAATEQRLQQAVGRTTLQLQRRVMQGKLSGQVLGVRTGTLRRSINPGTYTVFEPGLATGVVGTNLSYGVVHEYGYTGPVSVRAHLREVRQAFGRQLKTPRSVMVRPHTRSVDLPARSFLRTALQEIEPLFQSEIRAAVAAAIEGQA